MPKRIQMTRQRPWRADNPDAVRVDRATKWGNPFKVGDAAAFAVNGRVVAAIVIGSREGAAAAFERLMTGRFVATVEGREITYPAAPDVPDLRGRDLACWCPADEFCHADVLLELANPPSEEV